MELSFRHGDREFFAVELPAGYRVEKVEGVNVRGWEVTDDPAGPRLSVNLLKQAKENEAFTVHVWRQGAVGQEGPTAVEVPLLNVSGAVRHVGRLIVRHSPALSVQAGEPSGLRRIDMPAETVPALREGPLGVRPFQAFAFMQLPFSMRLSAVVARPDVSARLETILRVAERERSLESRVLLTVGRRPLHQVRVEVPADLDVERVSCPGLFEWGVSRGAGPQVLTVYFADGLQGEVPIVLGGRLGQTGAVDEVAIPRLWVLDVGRQDGYIAVQTDPMYDAVARALAQIESVLPGRLGWLSAEQRPFVRLAFYYRVADYAGAVALQARRPDARCHTVTNVRVTDRAIEETTLVCFTIYNAGVQEFRFRLPARLADARVSIPLLRQKRLEPLPDGGVAVILELQDQVMNDVRVLIEHDRLLTDQEQEVTLPAVETGRTDRQYLAIESAGRDEVLIEPGDGLEGLTPQQKEWGLVAALFQGGSTQAFIAKSGAVAPRLTFRTKGRVAVETAGARIGLAEALLAVDDSGAYRGSQTYHVDNRTEQFLELELPPGAALWTVRVADALVKPILPEPANPRRVQVPLVKTAAGDLDYTVVLKYAGRLEVPGPVVAADLPFARTVNINVEQSHVELWLPVTRRWFAFGGTLRQVRQGGEFEAGFLAYQNKLAKRLMETLQYGNAFEQARAVSNLRDVNERLAQSQSGMVEAYAYNEALQAQVSESQKIVVTAGRQIEQARTVQEAVALSDNRGRMAEAFRSQKQGLARNQVVAARSNWDESEVRKGTHSAKVAVFDDAWFEKNALVVQQGEKEPPGAEAPDASPKPPAPTRPQGQTAQQADQPQAVQVLDDVELKKAGEKRLTKAPARRDLQNRAVQYQQRLDAARGKADEAQEPAESSMQVDVNGMADLQAAVDNDGVSEGRDMDDRGLPFVALPADMAGLASLDVSIPGFDPRRWRAYRFTTPRGAVQVTARALSGRLIEGLERLAVALAGVGIVLGVFRLWRPWRPSPGSRRAIATYVMLAGFLCLLAGVFPVYGAVLLLVGLIWRVGLAVSHRVAGA
ncbi:MAG: hypothetical protein BWZ02_02828 [Lentisphaerae bacterium ADurb.BinA184]|nr:MAG: hypothetical protein BWZ02_02828 [Lentisphaerae bacterium ADurb.BinA184]